MTPFSMTEMMIARSGSAPIRRLPWALKRSTHFGLKLLAIEVDN
jgi:hypothetical protein